MCLLTSAQRLNFWRFVSHFQSIHRGAFFMQLRTTTVRKLLPDSWGFLCPGKSFILHAHCSLLLYTHSFQPTTLSLLSKPYCLLLLTTIHCVCTVHTPDGSPCGLLNHLANACIIHQAAVDRTELIAVIAPVLAAAGAVMGPLAASLPILE